MAYPLRYQPDPSTNRSVKILFFANTDWYLYNFRLPLARHLRDQGHEVVMLSPPDSRPPASAPSPSRCSGAA